MTDWIKCSDRLPPLDEIVFVATNGSLNACFRSEMDEGWTWCACIDGDILDKDCFESCDYLPTHWRPTFDMPED